MNQFLKTGGRRLLSDLFIKSIWPMVYSQKITKKHEKTPPKNIKNIKKSEKNHLIQVF